MAWKAPDCLAATRACWAALLEFPGIAEGTAVTGSGSFRARRSQELPPSRKERNHAAPQELSALARPILC